MCVLVAVGILVWFGLFRSSCALEARPAQWPNELRAVLSRADVCQAFEAKGLYKQIEADLGRFEGRMSLSQQDRYRQWCAGVKRACFTIYILKGHMYVRHFFPGYQSRHRSTLHAIYRVLQRFGPLPDVQFVVEVTDGEPIVADLPVFIITRPRDRPMGVLYPDFTFFSWPEAVCPPERTHAYAHLYAAYQKLERQAAHDPEGAWGTKKDELFWRGGRVGNPMRNVAVQAVAAAPGANVKFMDWTSVSITGGNGAPGCVGLLDHCRYRYLAFMNGNTYSSRLKYQLLCGSCVFASLQQWVEWWSELFVPNVDYIQVRDDWSDAAQALVKIRSQPDGGRSIAEAARKKALSLLSEDAVDCYWFRLLLRASQVLPPPDVSDPEQLPASAKPIEDVLLFGNDVVMDEGGISGPVQIVR